MISIIILQSFWSFTMKVSIKVNILFCIKILSSLFNRIVVAEKSKAIACYYDIIVNIPPKRTIIFLFSFIAVMITQYHCYIAALDLFKPTICFFFWTHKNVSKNEKSIIFFDYLIDIVNNSLIHFLYCFERTRFAFISKYIFVIYMVNVNLT